MGAMQGNKGTMRISTTDVGEVTGYECVIESDVVEDTACLDTFKTYQQGIKSWSGSFTVWFDESGTTEHDTILTELLSSAADGQIASVRFEYQYGATSNGYITGTILVQSLTLSNPGVGGLMTMTGRFVGIGVPTWTDAV